VNAAFPPSPGRCSKMDDQPWSFNYHLNWIGWEEGWGGEPVPEQSNGRAGKEEKWPGVNDDLNPSPPPLPPPLASGRYLLNRDVGG
jgi:hypothetical protein